MEGLHWGTDTILTIMFAALVYFVKTTLKSNQEKHVKHFEHSSDMTLHETDRDREARSKEIGGLDDKFDRHSSDDDRRFIRSEKQLDDISKDIKDILKAMSKGGS